MLWFHWENSLYVEISIQITDIISGRKVFNAVQGVRARVFRRRQNRLECDTMVMLTELMCLFVCSECQWETSFQYDDASENFYDESAYRSRYEAEKNPIVFRDITVDDKEKYLKLYRQNRVTITMVEDCLTDERVKKEQIREFLRELI